MMERMVNWHMVRFWRGNMSFLMYVFHSGRYSIDHLVAYGLAAQVAFFKQHIIAIFDLEMACDTVCHHVILRTLH